MLKTHSSISSAISSSTFSFKKRSNRNDLRSDAVFRAGRYCCLLLAIQISGCGQKTEQAVPSKSQPEATSPENVPVQSTQPEAGSTTALFPPDLDAPAHGFSELNSLATSEPRQSIAMSAERQLSQIASFEQSASMLEQNSHEPATLGLTQEEDATLTALIEQMTSGSLTLEEWEVKNDELMAMGPETGPTLARILRDGSPAQRELAATTLAVVGSNSREVGDALQGALKDDFAFVRANAAAALLHWPDRADLAVSALIQILNEDDVQLRQMAAMNLNSLGSDAAPHVAQLQGVLERLQSSGDQETLTTIVELLGQIGRSATPALQDLQRIAHEQSGAVGTAAQNAILQIQSPVE